MSESDEKKLNTIKEIVQAVPVYQDLVQPAAQEIGKSLAIVAKTVNIALAPVSILVWGYDKIKDFIETSVAEKIKNLPPEQIVSNPDPKVIGQSLEALKFVGPDKDLRDMYANLIASSLDKKTAKNAHPAYVDIIKSLTPDEARILKCMAKNDTYASVELRIKKNSGGYRVGINHFSILMFDANCEHPELFSGYIDNLCRLGLLESPSGITLSDKKFYESIEAHPWLKMARDGASEKGRETTIQNKAIKTTSFGKQFIFACVIDKLAEGTERTSAPESRLS